MSKNWDKILLLAVAVVVIALSGLYVAKALGFAEGFVLEPATPDNELPPTDERRAKLAKQFVDQKTVWTTPRKGEAEKDVRLFVSIPIVESDGVLIDMLDPNAPLLRPPVTNAWLLNNDLDFLNAGVLRQDPDGDGFSSLAEWEAKTDPGDPDSHPPYAEKLVMISRQQQIYKLKFSATPDANTFQIQRLPTSRWPRSDSFLMGIGEPSEDEQFRVESFEEKTAERGGIKVDASVVTITYLPQDIQVDLIKNIETEIPTYFAELEFLLDPGNRFHVKEGDTFKLDQDPETTYRVVKVEEDSTTITYRKGSEPEQTVEIRRN
ncbi:MAG: Amuc_1099 family pilus-like system protein [Verrucomicrobiales bacterium]